MKRKTKLGGFIKFLLVIIIVFFCINKFKGLYLENFQQNSTGEYVSEPTNTNLLKNTDDDLILVNKKNTVGADYIPKDLIKPNITFLSSCTKEEMQLQSKAAHALEELFEGAKEDGIILLGSSGYRSYQSQVSVYQKYYNENGKEYAEQYVAKPGTSEHQTGLAIDVTNQSRCFDKTSEEAQWIAKNAYKYGFILRYPEEKTDITGYNYEPWHIRYVGKKVAAEIYNNSEILEEYLQNHS